MERSPMRNTRLFRLTRTAATLLLALVACAVALPVAAWAEGGASYLDETGTGQVVSAEAITSGMVTWGADGAERWYVVQGDVKIGERVTVSGKVHLILSDGASLTVNGGINVAGDDSLSIYGQEDGTGKLTADAGSVYESAGIGGGSGETGGYVAIAGGIVTATGGGSGAGIGGGDSGSAGTVTITGGTVTATGGFAAPSTGEGGAGIGGGFGSSLDSVIIAGGTVTATGNYNAAGIGVGASGSGGTVTIAGGTVAAKGGSGGAGIGGDGGEYGLGGTVVTISGGVVTATGGDGGSGIGAGSNGGDGTFSTGVDGHAVIVANSISDQSSRESWSGVIFEDGVGKVYGPDVAPTEDFSLPEDSTLEVPSGTTLTIGKGVTATVPEGSVVNNFGSIEGAGTLDGEGTQYLRGDGSIADTVVCTLDTFRVLASVEYVGMDGKPAKTAEDVEVLAVSSSMTAWGANDNAEHWYVVQGEVNIDKCVIVTGDVHLILADGAKLTVDGGIGVHEGNVLSIYGQEEGTGELVANGHSNNAGIGGSSSYNSGAIKIAGGTVTATGDAHGAGIGGGYNGTGGAVTITGGTVTATGGSSAAGIGGGNSYGQGNAVIISGGIVTATGGDNSAGIGGGSGGAGGTVDITGGTVVAKGNGSGAGIGGGWNSSGGTVSISGGIVTATGGIGGAGIGGGEFGSGGTVTISGGTVTAMGGDNSAGIGGGFNGGGGTVDITGGTVTAKGNGSGAGIGGGDSGSGGPVTIAGGTVTATSGTYGAGIGGGYSGPGGSVSITGGTVTATGAESGSGIGGGEGSLDGGTFSTGEDGHAVIFASSAHGAAISDQSGQNSWSGIIFEGNSGKVYGSDVTPTEGFTIPADHALTVPDGSGLTIAEGATMTNEGSVELAEGCTFINNGSLVNDGTFTVKVGAQASGMGPIGGAVTITKAEPKATASVNDITDTSFTVSAKSEYPTGDPLYAVAKGNTDPSDDDWQQSAEFTGLEPGTQYTVYVCYAGTDYYKAAVGMTTVWTDKAAQSLAADQVSATVETAAGASDGTISVSGLAEGATWEWRATGEEEWTAAEGATVEGLAPGTYEVRLAGSAHYKASEPVPATIQSFADTHDGITFPAGSTDTGDGTVSLPEGGGTVTLPGGSSVTLPGGSTVTVPGGSVVDLSSGAVTTPDGSVVKPNGSGGITVTLPDGTELTAPSGSTVSADGTVLDPSGNRVGPETPEEVDDGPKDDDSESDDTSKNDDAPGLAGTGDATTPVAGVVMAGLTALLAGLALRPRRR